MDMIEIKKGATYSVISVSGDDKPLTTDGEYIGYAILGEEGALCFKVKDNGKKKIRLIPINSISYIEFDEQNLVIKNKDEEKDKTNYIV